MAQPHAPFPLLRSYQSISTCPRHMFMFRNKVSFYGEELSPSPTPKLKDHPLSAVRNCLFNIFAPTLHIGDSSSIRTWGCAISWWQGPTYHGLPGLPFKKFTFCPQRIFNYVFCIEQTAIISPQSNYLLIFTILTDSVQRYYSKVELP
jgi:hypothetical protein